MKNNDNEDLNDITENDSHDLAEVDSDDEKYESD